MHNPVAGLFFGSMLLIGLALSPLTASGATGTDVQYVSAGVTVTGYLTMPDAHGSFPAIVAIHGWWGLNDWMRRSADRLADEGYIVLAVDLFREKTPANAEEAHRLSRSLSGEQAIGDLMVAVAYLKSREDIRDGKFAAVGWSMGGGYALTMALTVPDLAACVISYGRLVTERASIEKIVCPILGIFGEDDRSIPTRSVQAFGDACSDAGKSADIQIYPDVGHAFMNENEKRSYNLEASSQAWTRIVSFLDRTMK